MRYKNNKYIPSATDIKKAEAKTRGIARKRNGQYDGEVQCYFDNRLGEFYYEEFTNHTSYINGNNLEYIYSADVYFE